MKINTKEILLRGRSVLFTLLAYWSVTQVLTGQQIIVNSNGDRIIMYPDGSWRPLAPQDSILLQQYLQQAGTKDPGYTSVTELQQLHKGEEQEFLFHRCQELKRIIIQQEKKVQNEFRAATNAQFKASEMLRNAEANKEVLESNRLSSLEITFENSVKQLRQAKLNQNAIKKLAGQVQVISNNPDQITFRKLNQLQSKYSIYLAHFEPSAQPGIATAIQPPVKETKTPTEGNTTVEKNPALPAAKTGATSAGTIRHTSPPSQSGSVEKANAYTRKPYGCHPTLDSLDEATRRRHVVLAPEILFTHTDPDLRPYLKDRDLITCKASTWKVGPYVYLNVEFYVSSSHAQNNFGGLAKGSLLRLKLMNEDFVSLQNLKSDKGRIDPYTGYTVFTGQFALGKDEISALRKSEADKMRVLLSTFYEDYEVYNVDFFLHQLDCLMRR